VPQRQPLRSKAGKIAASVLSGLVGCVVTAPIGPADRSQKSGNPPAISKKSVAAEPRDNSPTQDKTRRRALILRCCSMAER
jgi:hypothetical protein